MPMIPELLILMLAAARIGVIFTPIFSGFSADALVTNLATSYHCGRYILPHIP